MTGPGSGIALLASPVRRLVLDTLSESGAMTAAAVGDTLQLHLTTARFHLEQLVIGGLLESRFEKQPGAGRPKKVYAVLPGSLPGDGRATKGLRVLAGLLADTFPSLGEGGDATPADVGRRWVLAHVPAHEGPVADTPGRWLAKVGQMVDVLGEWGYTPDVTTTDRGRVVRITLSHCPFLDLAQKHPAVVCGIHRGLISGALERLGEPQAQVSLEPFVGPQLCRAHLRTTTPFTPFPPEPPNVHFAPQQSGGEVPLSHRKQTHTTAEP